MKFICLGHFEKGKFPGMIGVQEAAISDGPCGFTQ